MAWLTYFVSIFLTIKGVRLSTTSVQVVQGSTITLTCNISPENNGFKWRGPYSGGSDYVIQTGKLNENLPRDLLDRFFFSNDNNGYSHFRIVNVQNIDIGSYNCSDNEGNTEVLRLSFEVLKTSSDSSYYRSLLIDSDTQKLIVGSMNFVDIVDISEGSDFSLTNITFDPKTNDKNYCVLSKPERPDCQNHIKIISKNTKDSYILCGTNAYAPEGYVLNITDGSKSELHRVPCLENPLDNFTALYSVSSNQNDQGYLYYGATTNGVSLISRQVHKIDGSVEKDIEGVNSNKWMKHPQFAGSFEIDDKVFFFFRETAIEIDPSNYRIYSRVAKVCKKDQGGNALLRDKWTTYQKARLNCSIPGGIPTYFDSIQDIVIRDNVFYGLFTTRTSGLSGSAICAFDVSTVETVLEGPFKEQENAESFWKEATNVPTPRPGECTNNSLSVPNDVLQFIVDHPLMHQTVQPLNGKPIFVLEDEELQRLELHRNMTEIVFYAASNTGKIYKVFSKNGNSYISSNYTIESAENIIWSIKQHGDSVYIGTDTSIRRIKVINCEQHRWIDTCVKDPHCAWINSSDYLQDNIEENYVQCNNRCRSISSLGDAGILSGLTHDNVDLTRTFPYKCPPRKPSRPVLIQTNNTTLTLRWFSETSIHVTSVHSYCIMYGIAEETEIKWKIIEFQHQGSEKDPQYATLENLRKGTLYNIKINAFNSIGNSSFTATITVSTTFEGVENSTKIVWSNSAKNHGDYQKPLFIIFLIVCIISLIALLVILIYGHKNMERKSEGSTFTAFLLSFCFFCKYCRPSQGKKDIENGNIQGRINQMAIDIEDSYTPRRRQLEIKNRNMQDKSPLPYIGETYNTDARNHTIGQIEETDKIRPSNQLAPVDIKYSKGGPTYINNDT